MIWGQPVTFFGQHRKQKNLWFSRSRFGSMEAALDAAWVYFRERFKAQLKPTKCGWGPVGPPQFDGLVYHGKQGDDEHAFCVEPGMSSKDLTVSAGFAYWRPEYQTIPPPLKKNRRWYLRSLHPPIETIPKTRVEHP